jgi:hypothetical protein
VGPQRIQKKLKESLLAACTAAGRPEGLRYRPRYRSRIVGIR